MAGGPWEIFQKVQGACSIYNGVGQGPITYVASLASLIVRKSRLPTSNMSLRARLCVALEDDWIVGLMACELRPLRPDCLWPIGPL